MLKRKKQRSCRCSKHRHGRPHITRGPCEGDQLREAVKERYEGKGLERAWLKRVRAKEHPDDIEL